VTERTLDLQRENEKLEEICSTDELTGLRNRRYLSTNLKNDIRLIFRKYYRNAQNQVIEKMTESDMVLLW